ncbi:unnamed protein product [Calypogeia fissa]
MWTYCTGPGGPSFSWIEWAYYILTTPCALRLSTFVINCVFLVVFSFLAVVKLWSVYHRTRLIRKSAGKENGAAGHTLPHPGPVRKVSRVGRIFVATVSLTGLGSLVFLVVLVWRFWVMFVSNWDQGSILEFTFAAVQFSTWLIFAAIVGHEKVFTAEKHPLSLRAWWVATFVLSTWAFVSAALQFSTGGSWYDPISVDDVSAIVIFFISLFLLVVAIRGETGLVMEELVPELIEPLLVGSSQETDGPLITDFAEASIWNRATWYWMNALLMRGSLSAFNATDIPYVAPDDRAEKMYNLFTSHWPQEEVQHPVRLTLIRCFWPQLSFVGGLALVRLSVMYVGPMLIQKFVDFSSGSSSSPYEGYYLTLILFAATCIQVLCAHHYNFESQKLGMLVRASLITSVYQKGLRLSSSARQSHGLGQIVQYMSVDVQQLSDVVIQVHNLWVLPLQIIVALTILYSVVGISMLAGLITMVSLVFITMIGSRQQKGFLTFLAKMRDSRLKATSEVLNNMKIIKLQSWEEHFRKRVEGFRQSEYGWLVKYWVSLSGNIFSLWISPSLVSVVTFGTCMLLNVELTPGRVFTATATFRILMEPVRLFPQALIAISQALVSLDRLDKFMVSRELDKGAVIRLPSGAETALAVEGGSFTWDDESTVPTLSDINIDVKRGSLVAVVGMVGSGKSSLLSSILGEMPKLSGKVAISGSTAYVAQTAWIQSGTIEENIMFGLPMDQKKYLETIRVCSLERDFEIMEHGDQTEIGERGINLSGGQKQRIQLARAVYQDCDIYLLDDIFSAVDAHTGSALFKDCIRGALKSKTVLLVTHQVEFLHGADQILVMRDGKIVQAGKYDQILKEGKDFESLVLAHDESLEKVGTGKHPEGSNGSGVDVEDSSSSKEHVGSPRTPQKAHHTQQRNVASPRQSDSHPSKQESKKGPSTLVKEEQRGIGRVSWNVYGQYLTKAFGWSGVVALLVMQTFWQGSLVCGDYWLAYETSEDNRAQFRKGKFFWVYASFAFVSWLMVLSRTALGTTLGLKTAQAFFLEMLNSIFRAPMSFFDTTPSGRILSRSSTDQSVMDVILAFTFGAILGVYFATFGILFVMIQITPPIFFVILPLTYVFFSYQAYFMPSSRELTRLDAVTKAPIIDHFSETVAGFTTIRSFCKQDQFSEVNVNRVNGNLRMDFHNNGANEWLGFRLEMIGTIVLCFTALLLVTLPRSIVNPDLVGLSLSYGFALNLSLYWVVLLACQVENKMVAVERIGQYTHIPSEAPLVVEDSRPSPEWPQKGTIVLHDLKLRYRPDTPLVLKGLSLTVRGGESVGVVGRTGSGKSTLLQALFRLVEPAGGRIFIDSVDISTLGLSDLRSKLGIIPQEPTLFQGTVRTNIDPLGIYSDEQIWEGLRKCQLADIIEDKPEKLDYEVADDGDNWSVGQKQLFCLGRALLKRSRILFLDEATASVDAQTDAIIQRTVREEFKDCTVISIAHRIPSVMDSDKVLVLDAGQVKEYDSPSNLLQRQNSLFTSLVREYAARAETSQ